MGGGLNLSQVKNIQSQFVDQILDTCAHLPPSSHFIKQSLVTIAGFPLDESIDTNAGHILSSQGLAHLYRFLLGFSKNRYFCKASIASKSSFL